MRKILVVEDEVMLRDAYGIMLAAEPYKVDLAADGQKALELCVKNQYDLILLDLMMPVLNGLEFLERFGAAKPPKTKIIMLSNVSSSQDLTKALASGAHKSVVKAGLTPKQFLAMVRHEVGA